LAMTLPDALPIWSLTSHEVAEMSAGASGAPSGSTTPHSPILGPPSAGTGTGSGEGVGSPGAGTSEESTGGGGRFFCGQVAVSGVVNGGVVLVTGCPGSGCTAPGRAVSGCAVPGCAVPGWAAPGG